MIVQGVVPSRQELELEPLLDRLGQVRFKPFDPLLIDFVDALSKALMTAPREYPEIIALGYWSRRASILVYQRELASLASERVMLMPRGLAFHVPPANVDTIFMYSWLLSLLVGNANLIRLSTRESPQVEIVCAKLAAVLSEARFAPIAEAVAIVRYGHDDSITSTLSSRCDLRVVWGGDTTVAALRAFPLHPTARELSFGDKFSFSVLGAQAYLDADAAQQRQLAERFFNDAMWFDQAGCSSPRLAVFVGERGTQASLRFFATFEQVIEAKHHKVDDGHAMAKLVFSFQAALDGRIREQQRLSSELSTLTVTTLEGFSRDHPGAGLFFVAHIAQLRELVPFVTKRDQTLGHFGIAREELAAFVNALQGRGVDRLVPLGQALTFNRYWDGYDLLQEFTRKVYLE
ncbi:MAG TPA: acyl-CoA reductase [Polyangiales bacterium]|nr:acyl-CoA reductase [Polyangiales bacterium]